MNTLLKATLVAFATVLPVSLAQPQEAANFLRSGQFREITDSAVAGYTILDLRMSANGEKAVFATTGPYFPFTDAIRVIDTDGSGEHAIFQRVDDDRAGFDGIAISDDGTLVVYAVGVGGNSTELRLYHADTAQDELLLRELPRLSFGILSLLNLAHFGGSRLLAISGDGQYVFFINRFGPIGGGNEGMDPSGQTLYRIHTGSKAAQAIFSQADLDDVPGIAEGAVELLSSHGSIATDHTGSVVLLPVGGFGASANPPRSLLRIVPSEGAASAQVVLQLTDTLFTGPSLRGDGGQMVVSRRGGGFTPDGVLLLDADGSGDPLVLDPGFQFDRPPLQPHIARDGSAVIDRVELSGGDAPSVRWMATDGSGPLPVSQNTIAVFGANTAHSISADGSRIALLGGVRTSSVLAPGKNIVIFDWLAAGGIDADIPEVQSVVAEPSFEFIRQPFLSPEVTTKFTYTPTSVNLGDMQSWIYNHVARDLRVVEFGGIGNNFAVVSDDGTLGDEAAGDGIYNDAGIWALSSAQLGAPTGRAAITSTNRTASFVDFPLSVREAVPPIADFSAVPTSGAAPLTVTFTNQSSGDYVYSDWNFTNSGSFYSVNNATAPVENTYNTPGVYSVRMRARGFGNEDILVKESVITVLEPGSEGEGEGEGEDELPAHSADQDGDGIIVLVELLRVIQFFNSGGFHCADEPTSTEDGYMPGLGANRECTPHASDYNGGADWQIDLTELLRLIQFYNSGGLRFCPGQNTEDGYCPGLLR